MTRKKRIVGITMAEKRPSSRRRVYWIALDIALVLGMLYWFTYSRGMPAGARIALVVLLIAGFVVTTVNFFRKLLRSSKQEAEQNPKPW